MCKSFFVSAVVLLFALVTPTLAQTSEKTTINERLSLYLPILQRPHCTTYITEFGASKKAVEAYAETIGTKYFSTMPIPAISGVTASLFVEPDNLKAPTGEILTDFIMYSFIFNDDNEYFSFSANIRFKSNELAQSFYEALLSKVNAKTTSPSYTEVIKCDKTKKKRMVIMKVDGNSITYVVFDYDTLMGMSIDASKI